MTAPLPGINVNLCEIIGCDPDDPGPARLAVDRVCSFELTDDCTGLEISEQCDQAFGFAMDRNDVDRLITFLESARAQMPPP